MRILYLVWTIVEKMDDCTVRIEKETYKDLYALMRFVIKVCNAYA